MRRTVRKLPPQLCGEGQCLVIGSQGESLPQVLQGVTVLGVRGYAEGSGSPQPRVSL